MDTYQLNIHRIYVYIIKCKLKGLLFINISNNNFRILMCVGLSNKTASSHQIGSMYE